MKCKHFFLVFLVWVIYLLYQAEEHFHHLDEYIRAELDY